MFKDRHFEVKIRKDPKTTETDNTVEELASVDYSDLVRETTNTLIETTERWLKTAVIGIGVYVAADTLRQVIVKITPSN